MRFSGLLGLLDLPRFEHPAFHSIGDEHRPVGLEVAPSEADHFHSQALKRYST